MIQVSTYSSSSIMDDSHVQYTGTGYGYPSLIVHPSIESFDSVPCKWAVVGGHGDCAHQHHWHHTGHWS